MRTVTRMLSVLAVSLLAAALPAQVVQLKGGHTLIGQVQEPGDEGLTLRRLDTGGVLQLRWDQLTAESAQKIKASFGLSTDEQSEVMVTADVLRFRLDDGGSDEVVGKKVDETPTHIILERLGQRWEIRRKSIMVSTSREVPALDIFTKDRFYADQLARFAPGEDPDKHVLLADMLMRVRDYEHAKQHLEQARDLGGGRQPAALDGKLRRVQLYIESSAERGVLDDIGVQMARGNWKKGLELIESYESSYAQGRLAGEFAKLKDRFAKARARFMVRKVVELWHRTEVNLARKKATEYGVELGAIRDYAESQMGKDIREHVGKVAGLQADEIEQFWKARLELGSALRSERYSYGLGTWVLGEQAILKDTKQGTAETQPQKSQKDQVEEQRLRRIQRAIERARRAAQRQRDDNKQENTPEDWWKEASTDEKRVWLRAYYAEFGGDLEVTSAHLNDCLTCGGRGFLEVYEDAGKPKKETCPTCRGTRFKRWIRAR